LVGTRLHTHTRWLRAVTHTPRFTHTRLHTHLRFHTVPDYTHTPVTHYGYGWFTVTHAGLVALYHSLRVHTHTAVYGLRLRVLHLVLVLPLVTVTFHTTHVYLYRLPLPRVHGSRYATLWLRVALHFGYGYYTRLVVATAVLPRRTHVYAHYTHVYAHTHLVATARLAHTARATHVGAHTRLVTHGYGSLHTLRLHVPVGLLRLGWLLIWLLHTVTRFGLRLRWTLRCALHHVATHYFTHARFWFTRFPVTHVYLTHTTLHAFPVLVGFTCPVGLQRRLHLHTRSHTRWLVLTHIYVYYGWLVRIARRYGLCTRPYCTPTHMVVTPRLIRLVGWFRTRVVARVTARLLVTLPVISRYLCFAWLRSNFPFTHLPVVHTRFCSRAGCTGYAHVYAHGCILHTHWVTYWFGLRVHTGSPPLPFTRLRYALRVLRFTTHTGYTTFGLRAFAFTRLCAAHVRSVRTVTFTLRLRFLLRLPVTATGYGFVRLPLVIPHTHVHGSLVGLHFPTVGWLHGYARWFPFTPHTRLWLRFTHTVRVTAPHAVATHTHTFAYIHTGYPHYARCSAGLRLLPFTVGSPRLLHVCCCSLLHGWLHSLVYTHGWFGWFTPHGCVYAYVAVILRTPFTHVTGSPGSVTPHRLPALVHTPHSARFVTVPFPICLLYLYVLPAVTFGLVWLRFNAVPFMHTHVVCRLLVTSFTLVRITLQFTTRTFDSRTRFTHTRFFTVRVTSGSRLLTFVAVGCVGCTPPGWLPLHGLPLPFCTYGLRPTRCRCAHTARLPTTRFTRCPSLTGYLTRPRLFAVGFLPAFTQFGLCRLPLRFCLRFTLPYTVTFAFTRLHWLLHGWFRHTVTQVRAVWIPVHYVYTVYIRAVGFFPTTPRSVATARRLRAFWINVTTRTTRYHTAL